MLIPLYFLLLAVQVLALPTPGEPSFTEILAHIHASNPIQWNRITLPDGREARTTFVELKQFEDAKQTVFAKRGVPPDLIEREERKDGLEKRPVIIVTPGGNRARSREGLNPFTEEKSKALEERGDPDSGGENSRRGILAKRPEIIVTPVVTKACRSEKADDVAKRGDPDSGGEDYLPRSILEKRPKIIISPIKPGTRDNSLAILEKRPIIVVTPINDAPKLATRDRETGRPREDRTYVYTSTRFPPRSLEKRNIPAGYIWQTLCRNFGAITAWQNFVDVPSDAACNWFNSNPPPTLVGYLQIYSITGSATDPSGHPLIIYFTKVVLRADVGPANSLDACTGGWYTLFHCPTPPGFPDDMYGATVSVDRLSDLVEMVRYVGYADYPAVEHCPHC